MLAIEKPVAWVFVVGTVVLTVYCQLVLKWQVSIVQESPYAWIRALPPIAQLVLRPWVISAFAAAFLASLCWMYALGSLELGRAYPFMALNFVLVALASAPLFGESISISRVLGLLLIVAGLFLIARS